MTLFEAEAELFDYLGYLGNRIGDFLSDLLSYVPFGEGAGGEEGAATPKGRRVVPDVQGLSVEDARHLLSREGFKVVIRRLEERPAPVMGTVVGQDPRPGTRRHRGPVRIHVNHPRHPQTNPRKGSPRGA
jgi:hypothetical protein